MTKHANKARSARHRLALAGGGAVMLAWVLAPAAAMAQQLPYADVLSDAPPADASAGGGDLSLIHI